MSHKVRLCVVAIVAGMRPWMRAKQNPAISLIVILASFAIATRSEVFADEGSAPAVGPAASVSQVVRDLSSKDFAQRQAATDSLRTLTSGQLADLGAALDREENKETLRRLIEVLERHYLGSDRHTAEVRVTSELLERAAESNQWFIAEAARDALKRHGQRRVSLAIDELVELNANLNPRSADTLWQADARMRNFAFGGRDMSRNDILKIYIDKAWPTGARATQLLRRLEPLVGSNFLRDRGNLAIVLADGHPLTAEEVATLRGIFGDTQIQERGSVSLGVQQDPFGEGVGVTVGPVQPGSTAFNAGIRSGDRITDIDDTGISDFDALVTKLRDYKVGDKAKITVQRSENGIETGEAEVIEVTFQAWGEPQVESEDVESDEAVEPLPQ